MRTFRGGAVASMLLSLVLSATAHGAETRVYVNARCVVADEPVVSAERVASKSFGSGIVASVSQALLGDVIGGIATLISKSARGRDFVYEATQDVYLYQGNFSASPLPQFNAGLSCVTVVAGDFEPDGADCKADYVPAELDGSIADEDTADAIDTLRRNRRALNVLRRANICLQADPAYVFEARLTPSIDGSGLRIEDAGYEINRLQSAKRDKDRRAIVTMYSLLAPSADGRGRLLATGWLEHGELGQNERVIDADTDRVSNWTQLPSLTGAARQAFTRDAAASKALHEEVEKLERGILMATREQMALIDAESAAEGDAAAALRVAIKRLDTKLAVDAAKLSAQQQALSELPPGTSDYYLAQLRVSVTESRSEKAMSLWIAEKLQSNRRLLSFGILDAVDSD